MITPSALATPGGVPPGPALLPLPPELPDGLPHQPRILQLTDADAVDHALVGGTGEKRSTDEAFRRCLGLVQATARGLDPCFRLRCAASTLTARLHLAVLAEAPANTWVIRRGVDGADHALLEELDHLVAARLPAARARKRAGGHADLVILVAQDHIFAPRVRQLRLLGVPTWLLVPSRFVAARLYSAATAVTFLRPADPWPGARSGR